MKVKNLGKNRIMVGSIIVELSKRRSFGLQIEFSFDEWKIHITVGYVLGTLYVSFPHKFLFRAFPRVFYGKNFGERGREVGFNIDGDRIEYSLFWWSDCNKPCNTWRCGYKFLKG